MKTHYDMRGSRPAGLILRSLAFLTDISVCAFISTYALRGVALRFREQVAHILGIHAFTLAIDAGTVSAAELSERFTEHVLDLEVELLDLTLVFALAALIVVSFIAFGYFSLAESRPFSATLGKASFGMKVVNEKYDTFGILHSIYRQIAKLVTLFTLGAGFFFLPLSKHQRALHDKIAGTNVIRIGAGYARVYRLGRTLLWLILMGGTAYAVYQRLLVVHRWYLILRLTLPSNFFPM